MPKLVTPVAVRAATRHATAVAALVPVVLLPVVLAVTPALAQDGGGFLGLLSRLVPRPSPAAAMPAPPPAPAMILLPPLGIGRPIPASAWPGPPAAVHQAWFRWEPRRLDVAVRRAPPRLRVRPQVAQAAQTPPPMPARAKDPERVENPVPGLLGDRTLRSGDLAMSPDSLRVFTGRPGPSHALGDFAPLGRAGAALPASLRRLAAGLQPGWNRAWSTAGLAFGSPPPGTRREKAAAAASAEAPSPPAQGRPAAAAAARVAAIAPSVTVQEAPRAPGPVGPPPRLRGCPGGARAGEDAQLREAFACTPAPTREEAAGSGGGALVQLAQMDVPGD